MISLSSIVKSGSFYVYTESEKNGNGRVKEKDNSFGELDKRKELMLEQALRKSRHIYDEALKRANDIIEKAKDEGISIRIEAEQRGYQEGYVKGIMDGARDARKSSEEGLLELEGLIEEMKAESAKAIDEQKDKILELSFEIAKKIMKQHIQTDENAIAGMLEDILHENETGVKIYLSEYSKCLNIALDKDIAKKLKKAAKNVKVIAVQSDDTIMVETENGVVDASIPVQLIQLRDALNLEK